MTDANPYANNIPLAGFYNLRDGGDLPVPGGHLKSRRLLRSDQPSALSEASIAFLRELPLNLVIDLRTEEEVKATPDPFVRAGFEVNRVPILSGSIKSMMANIPSIASLYEGMIEGSGPQLARAVAAVSDGLTGHGAVIVHCTAGKDRTGVVIALCQSLLGVSRADIIDNYTATHANLEGAWFQEMMAGMAKMMGTDAADFGAKAQAAGIDLAALKTLATGSPADAIESALDLVESKYGGVEKYLTNNGLAQEEIDALRAKLIEG